jgi:cation diffusion facilitator CzcD-associated flavoprotein CzcO
LNTVKGMDVHTFGEPMSFWLGNMPVGMLLRSGWAATHIASPGETLTLEAFKETTGSHFSAPVPLESFVNYGLWFQRKAVPNLDLRKVQQIEQQANGFGLLLDDGETLHAARVVVAGGIRSFAWCPREFEGIPSALVTHTSVHRGFQRFAGRSVLVIGSGQSALESAALLHESGARVEIIARARQIRWLGGLISRTIHSGFGPELAKILYAPTDVGPAGISQIVARPNLVRRFPRPVQDWFRKRSIRPAGARWLVARLATVPMKLGHTVVSAVPVGGRVKAKLSDGSERMVDHIFLGTGYRVNVSRYPFFSRKIAQSLSCFKGYPRLREGFETSIPGLHILGAPAVWSFGALMQFVVGTHYSSRELLRCIAAKAAANKFPVAERLVAEVG